MRESRIQHPRCHFALTDGEVQSRCMKSKGHNGGHVAPDVKEYPYTRIHWFAGDSREFVTKKENVWAWKVRRATR